MITQAIKEWLHKVAAWWPWKQSSPLEYEHMTSALAQGFTPGTTLWTSKEETAPQAGATPRRFPLENRSERLMQPRSEAADIPPLAASTSFPAIDSELTDDGAAIARQRLEFLRYLVQRGIVNEGFESEEFNPPG